MMTNSERLIDAVEYLEWLSVCFSNSADGECIPTPERSIEIAEDLQTIRSLLLGLSKRDTGKSILSEMLQSALGPDANIKVAGEWVQTSAGRPA